MKHDLIGSRSIRTYRINGCKNHNGMHVKKICPVCRSCG